MARSRSEMVDVECPSCGRVFRAEVWLALDHQERPDLVRRLLDGTLNVTACPQCESEGGLTSPLLYHDGARELLLCAMPLSVHGLAAARSVVGDLRQGLIAAMPVEERRPYLREVEVVAELDGLRALLFEQELEDERASDQRSLAEALQALLNAAGQLDFQRVVAEQRRFLLTPQAELALDGMGRVARETDDRELQRRVREAKALLSRLRSVVQSRRRALADLLDSLAPLTEEEARVIPELHCMLEAVDPQEVYAARISLDARGQEILDRLVERLAERAETQHEPEALAYLRRLRSLPRQ